jgi:hypothetical protein
MSCAITCRLLRFRSPLLSESRLMSFPRATEMFQFTRFASHSYVFTMRYLCRWVSPFGNLRIKANLPAPRSLSQAITSFVAYHCQGIHHMLLFTWPYNFDIFFKNQSIFKECLSGLSPDALCRIQALNLNNKNLKREVWYSFWRNQNYVANNYARHGLH